MSDHGSDAGRGGQAGKDPVHASQESGLTPEEAQAANLPASPGTTPEPEQRGERRGMFGARGGGDTTGFGGLVAPILYPAASPRPYGRYFDEVADELERGLSERGETTMSDSVRHVVVDRGEMTLVVAREHLPAVVRVLRDAPALRFELCTGVSGVHFPDQHGEELHAVYHFASVTHGGRRVRIEVTCPDADRHIPSIVETYPSVTWHERETWDMFGIVFDGHPALTRILMPDDWPGHPQRKDYPLGGIPVEYKGATVPPPDQRRSYN